MYWNREYKGIAISFEDRIVRIMCDEVLKKYLKHSENDTVVLAEYILGTYYDFMGKQLQISKHSLAVEILIHVYFDQLCVCVQSKNKIPIDSMYRWLEKACQSIRNHTEIIDCGEREVDSNRFIFDALERFHEIIYKLLSP